MASVEPGAATTIPAIFAERVGRSAEIVAYTQFNRKTNVWVNTTWSQVRDLVEQWRRGFAASKVAPGDRVALLLDNGLNWVCFDQAALSLGLVTVPLFSTDSPENWAHILGDSAPALLMVGRSHDWDRLRPLRDRFPSVRTIVCAGADAATAEDIVSLSDWLERGVSPPRVDVQPDALATITYSSGTTGRPKGVMLSHGNLASATSAVLASNRGYNSDVFLSFLPMAHAFARTVEYYAAMACGGRMAFARSIAELADDFTTVRPTILMGVPRIYERAWTRIEAASKATPLGAWMFKAAVGLYAIRNRSIAHRVASRALTNLVKRQVLARFGGRLRLVVSGSAPLSRDLALGLRAVGLPLVEGYGMAEAAGPVSGDTVADYQAGTVGYLLQNVDARLSETGELLIRSPSVMQGYWGKAEETKQAIDEDGWLHTGDLAEWVDKRIKIVGRVHDVIVTATGEKLAPAEVEFRIASNPLFDQVVVIGNNRPFVTALAVLDQERWAEVARANALDPAEPNTSKAEKLLLKTIAATTADLPNYAQVRRLHATLEPWTAEGGLATVTMKLKRSKIEERYRDAIDRLYEKAGRTRVTLEQDKGGRQTAAPSGD